MRRGIEQGDYVYQRGELLFGPGDPPAGIVIDEQVVILTMAYARNRKVWPRQKADDDEDPGPDPGPEPEPPPSPDPPPHPPSDAFTAEGVLREALTRLWEQARAKEVAAIGVLSIRMFEAGDAFRLLGAVGAVSGAEKIVTFSGGYETREGGSFEMEFRGPPEDAQPVKEFLDPQLRDAVSTDLQAGFDLTFTAGLGMQGDAAEKFTERLSRFASGAAYVSATAKART